VYFVIAGGGQVGFHLAQALIEAGTTFFTVGLSGPRYDVSRLTDWIAFRNEHNKA
jgi:nucleoside-diphosphate-sugar epimerase